MSKHSVPRVYLGKPYNREFWWNTARRILNEHHRGEFDVQFTRNQRPPDAAGLHHPKSSYLVGGVGVENVQLYQVPKYTELSHV